MKLTPTFAISVLAGVPAAKAWGSLGHQTVAFIASNFVEDNTRTFLQNILHNETSTYLAGVATWADSFRYTKAGTFSASFHYIDAQDDPPTSCGVKYSRDCGSQGCIVGAIQNYTTQLLNPALPEWQRTMAAKFIVHFLGDIHQPLHTEHLDVGGNSIKVIFDGVATNLHHVWDSNIPEKLIGSYKLADALEWGNTLTEAIKTGIYQPLTESWLEGMNLYDPVTSSLVWAEESNTFICTTVLKDGVTGVEAQELGGDYYDAAVPVIQLQIAKAGYRLARWMDLIAQSVKTDLKTDLKAR